ncbi:MULTISPECIES: DUF413 domain-containing protein [unclassified Thioalkalivibrio]|uniref:DUF413 domain-containing protein n=2 Tax=Thioalkalivibrio TaxID=106633 RepID=UPI0003609C8F|nr:MULTISPECIES: DUF413 domain-containing protein [unclassified Thioalkalivibrio]
MPHQSIAISSVAQSMLTDFELEIVRKHHDFFHALTYGVRSPRTPEQRHFVDVVEGQAQPWNDYERAWKKYLKLYELEKRVTELEHDFDRCRKERDEAQLGRNRATRDLDIANDQRERLTAEMAEMSRRAQAMSKDLARARNEKEQVELDLKGLSDQFSSYVALSETEANLIAKKLMDGDAESIDLAKSIIEKIKSIHRPKVRPADEGDSWEKCKACGSPSQHLCRCSE